MMELEGMMEGVGHDGAKEGWRVLEQLWSCGHDGT